MGEPYIQQIYTSGGEQPLQPLWQPRGIIIINECDSVIAVTDGRQTWRCSPGRTISRPMVAPSPGGYRAKAEQASTQGSATVIFTQEAITEFVGEDASLANLFRRTWIDTTVVHTTNNLTITDTTITLGAARLVQVIVTTSIQATDGTVRITITDGRTTGTPQTLVEMTVPYTAGDAAQFRWRFGEGGEPLPRALRVRVISSAGFASPQNDVGIYSDVWEGD